MTANLASMAKLLADNPYTTNLPEEAKKAETESDKQEE